MTKAEMEKRITEMEQELSNLKAQLNKPEKKTGWEKPKHNENYYLIHNDGLVMGDGWSNLTVDLPRYNIGNCFTSKELAENIARYQSLDLRIRRRIAEICEPINWIDSSFKFGIYYNHGVHKLEEYSTRCGEYGLWVCDTREHAEQIIEEFKDELTWYFTEFKDRMDSLPEPDYD